MRSVALPWLGAAALVVLHCSPLRDGVTPVQPGYTPSPGAFSIALMGDIPYSARQVELFEELLEEVNGDPTVDLVLHAGDIKGSGACDDDVYRERFDLFQRFEKPFIYSIGDNEWADCHREDNGRYHPLERLDLVRRVFFANPSRSLGGRPIPLRRQSAMPGFEPYVEHVVFLHKGIVFGTAHVVGSHNDLAPWLGIDPEDSFEAPRLDRLREFQAREAAVARWLQEIFRLARDQASAGVVILIQGDPRFELDRDDRERAGFNGFVDALRDRAAGYGKPVLLVHGHVHFLLIDKPLSRTLTRIRTPGSPFVRWIKVTIDPASPDVFLLVSPFVHTYDSIPW